MFRQRLAVLAACAAAALSLAASAAEPPSKVIGAYYPGGSAERYPVADIPADTLTHLFYAFATIDAGRCVVEPQADAHFKALAALKRAHPTLHTLISIGGWNAGGFSNAALTADSRARFVASCVALFFDTHRGSFDGVDIDWEFPVYGGPLEVTDRPQDRRNMTLLVREFRRQLDAAGTADKRHLLLTAALPAGRVQTDGPYDPARSYALKELGQTLDFINLMSYDMGTGFSAVSTFNAPLREVADDPLDPAQRRWNNVEGAVAYYQQHGVPASNWCWACRSTGAVSAPPLAATMACTSLTAARSMPVTGDASAANSWTRPAGSGNGIRWRRVRGCTTRPNGSSSAMKTRRRSGCAPRSPSPPRCAGYSPGS